MPDMFKLQYRTSYLNGKSLIDSLQEKEGLFIINNQMQARVLFYYKENKLFFSEPIDLNIESIDYGNEIDISLVCEYITNNFDGTDKLRLSTLVSDKESFIKNYLIDSLVVKVNRLTKNIIEIISLEFYNDLFLFNNSIGIMKIFKEDNSLYYYQYKKAFDGTLDKILDMFYDDTTIYPMCKTRNKEKLNVSDLLLKNKTLLIFSIISSEEVLLDKCFELKRLKYEDSDIIKYLDNILSILNSYDCDDVVDSIQDLTLDLYYKYDKLLFKIH